MKNVYYITADKWYNKFKSYNFTWIRILLNKNDSEKKPLDKQTRFTKSIKLKIKDRLRVLKGQLISEDFFIVTRYFKKPTTYFYKFALACI